MQITLNKNGSEKTYINDFVKARHFRNALKLNKEFRESNLTIADEETYQKLSEFTVSVFDNQFTLDELEEGISAKSYLYELQRIFNEVLNLGGLEVQSDEGNEQGK
ncbi:phage tail assembly chaperone G [Niallia sp. Krafla_26]|uniref:phage tail assembly chaperone G n=1 Tax=Niallia sp. Krafla_26 TaxID=3064703 RepID=UPI003D17211E